MIDRALGRDIDRLVDELVPPAPWLDDRVMQSIAESAPRDTIKKRTATSFGYAVAGVAAVTIAALIIGVLLSSRLPALSGPAIHPAPSRDSAVVAYRALIDTDMRNIEAVFQKGCDTRARCATQLEDTRTATDTLLRDTSATAPPQALVPLVQRLRAAAEQFTAQLDNAIYVVAEPNTDYVTASSAPSIVGMTSAAAELDCWPATPIDSGHGLSCS